MKRNSKNSLISLAYIKVSSNPLQVFCNYILYLLLIEPNQTLSADVLKDRLKEEFGLDMPQTLIENCARVLTKNKNIERLHMGKGYKILKTDFNIDKFNETRKQLHEHEATLLKELIKFVKEQYEQTWSEENAREYLSSFLDEEGYGAELFLHNKLGADIYQQNYISTSFYIGRFIEKTQQEKNVLKDYLEEIVIGMMILQGLRQTENYQQNKDQKFRGTTFYFDTKLVLRALGFSVKAYVDSIRELVRLIKEKYEAKIGVFPQTVNEVINALYCAGEAIQKHEYIDDWELRMYSEIHKYSEVSMSDFSQAVPRLLSQYLYIEDVTNIDWNKKENRRYNIDVEKLKEYILNEHEWKLGAVRNDVDVINQINILRRGNYTQRYGGQSKLPVFVTSNTQLVHTFQNYIYANQETEQFWNPGALPVISDNMLLFRMWLPYASENSDLPSLTLSRFAYSAQSEGILFYEKFRNMASKLEKTENIDLIDTTEVARKKIEDILVKDTNGNIDRIDENTVMLSLEEYTRIEAVEMLKNNEKVIKLLRDKFVNKLGIYNRALLIIIKFWSFIASGVLFLLTCSISSSKFVCMFSISPIFLEAIMTIVGTYFENMNLLDKLNNKTVEYVKRKYIQKIEHYLNDNDFSNLRDDVINYCIENTNINGSYISFFKDKLNRLLMIFFEYL